MVIAGLVIALGEIVDDAIIDVENIGRRLRLNRAAAAIRSSAFAVVLAPRWKCAARWCSPRLIVMLVFLPVFFLGGVAGDVLPAAGAGLCAGDRRRCWWR
jgi:Cu/Ag efflux pump CusA